MWCSSAAGSSSLTVSPLRLYRNKDASASVSQLVHTVHSADEAKDRVAPRVSLPVSLPFSPAASEGGIKVASRDSRQVE